MTKDLTLISIIIIIIILISGRSQDLVRRHMKSMAPWLTMRDLKKR